MQKSFPLPLRQSWGLVLVPIAVGMVTALGISLHRPPGSLSHIFLYLLIVIGAAAWWGLPMALYAIILSVLAINLFFFQPYGSLWFQVDSSTFNSELLGLIFFATLAFVLTYLTLALRRERDRAQLLAERERTAKEAVVQASLRLERQHRRALYLQQARQLLGDTLEPESVLPKVLDELVTKVGGRAILLLESYSRNSETDPPDQAEPAPTARFWQAGYARDFSPSLRDLEAADMVLPLRTGSQLFGRLAYTFGLAGSSDEQVVEEKREITTSLLDLAEYIAVSLENGQLYQTLEFQNNEMAQLLRSSLRADTALTKRAEQLSIFYRLSAAILSGLNRTDLMMLGLTETARVLDCRLGAVLLFPASSGQEYLELVARRGEISLKEGSQVPVERSLAGQVAKSGQPFMSNFFERESRLHPVLEQAARPVRSCIYVPLVNENEPLGVIVVGSFEPEQYGPEDLDFLQGLAGLLTMALVSQRYYTERERAASVEERNRIARELHDGLAQSITYIGLKMQLIEELYTAGEHAAVGEEVARVAKAAEMARSDVREALYGLRHTEHDRSLLENLADLVRKVSDLSGITIHLTHSDPARWPPLSLNVQIQLLRIVQEALSNVQKHSQATEAEVGVEWLASEELLKITVSDNGIGFDPGQSRRGEKGQHLGLGIMRERAARVGTRLNLTSQPGSGTQICLEYRPAKDPRAGTSELSRPLPLNSR